MGYYIHHMSGDASSQLRILTDVLRYFESLIYDIESATATVDFEVYIFDTDPLGQQVAKALIDAAQRGVVVRLLIDGVGSNLAGSPLMQELLDGNVKVRVFNPPPWKFWLWEETKGSNLIRKLLLSFSRINRRNHRKICLIDRCIAWVGSFNITQIVLPKEYGGEAWRETAVRLQAQESELDDLRETFEHVWESRPEEDEKQSIASKVIRLNTSRKERKQKYSDFLLALEQAKHKIWITNAYFVPEAKLLKELIVAAKSGIDVRIILPSNSDVFFQPWASYTFYELLLKSGVRIFEYLPTNLHAKTLVIDETAIIGSSNLNHRSLFHDLEVDLVLSSASVANEFSDFFLEDQKQSREIILAEWGMQRLIKKFFGKVILVLRYWL